MVGWIGHVGDEAIAATWNGLDIFRVFRIFTKRVAKLANGCIDGTLAVNESILAPDVSDDFLACEQPAVAGCQQQQKLHRNALKLYRVARFLEHVGFGIEFKGVELHDYMQPSEFLQRLSIGS